VQATCDADRRFTDFDIRWPGSTSDTLAWLSTGVHKAISEGRVPSQFFFVGDAAYPCSHHMLTPVPGRASSIGRWADSYNFHQSQLRINVECAFGILIRRWGILWKPLECKFSRVPAVISACMRLHNFCSAAGNCSTVPPPNHGDGSIFVAGRHISMAPRMDRDGIPIEMLSSCALPATEVQNTSRA
jgi:hypothetical protein